MDHSCYLCLVYVVQCCLKDLSIDEMVEALCFGCLSSPPGFNCWVYFAPVFSFIYC